MMSAKKGLIDRRELQNLLNAVSAAGLFSYLVPYLKP